MGKGALIETELDSIAAILEANGYEVLFGYKDGCKQTVFYNDSVYSPVHSLHFSSCNLEDEGVWELLGGFIAYPICEGSQKCKGFVSLKTSAEHLFGGEVEFYQQHIKIAHPYLDFAKFHYPDDSMLNEFVPGGLHDPLVVEGMLEGHDMLKNY